MLCFITFFEVPKKAGDAKAESKVRRCREGAGRAKGGRKEVAANGSTACMRQERAPGKIQYQRFNKQYEVERPRAKEDLKI